MFLQKMSIIRHITKTSRTTLLFGSSFYPIVSPELLENQNYNTDVMFLFRIRSESEVKPRLRWEWKLDLKVVSKASFICKNKWIKVTVTVFPTFLKKISSACSAMFESCRRTLALCAGIGYWYVTSHALPCVKGCTKLQFVNWVFWLWILLTLP